MPALIVKLPHDRDFCGEIRLIGDDGAALAGPFKIAGCAAAAPAKAAGNAARSPLMRYGDTPTGRYKIRNILQSGVGTGYREADYGGSGIIVLDPRGGDAALAEANGRFHVFVQGGATVDGRLCATNGALRMRNEDLAILCTLLGEADGVECWCVEDAKMAAREAVEIGNVYDEGDPPPLIKPALGRDVSRRRMLAGGAMLSISPSLVLLPGIFIAAQAPSPALAQTAYPGDSPDNNGQDNNQDNSSQDQQSNPDNGGQDNNQNGDTQDQQQSPDNNGGQDDNSQDNNTPKAY